MKKFFVFAVLAALLVGAVATDATARRDKGRKLPHGSYITSAKIEIISGDPDRYPLAVALLDSLFMHYGPHAEGLFLMAQIAVDGIESEGGPVAKRPYVLGMRAYVDSLHMCCNNDEIKKKYRKGCDDFVAQADSIAVKYWREFYHAGLDQLKEMESLTEEVKTADSAAREYLEGVLTATSDSCRANMELAILIDDSDTRSFVGMGQAFELVHDFDQAIAWKMKGLENTTDSASLLFSIAYNYINQQKFAEGAPFLDDYLTYAPNDTANLFNLAVCYNNSEQYDSGQAVYQRILALDPNHVEVLGGIGRYWNEMYRRAGDSLRYFQTQGDDGTADAWMAKKDVALDSSLSYFGRGFEADPSNAFVVENYALMHAISGKYEEAAVGYDRLTTLDPSSALNWTSLGDCHLGLKRWAEAAAAYEHVVELQPSNLRIWEQLEALYQELKQSDKEKAAAGKIEELQG